MAITTRDQLVNALANNNSPLLFDKANISNTGTGQYHSLWRATGQPGQGVFPTGAAVCSHETVGAHTFTQQSSPATSYLGLLEMTCSMALSTVEFHDRLMHMGGLSGTSSLAQTATLDLASNLGTSNLTERVGNSNLSDVSWWLEWYTDTGPTGVGATVSVTFSDNSTGNLTMISLAANRRASFMVPLNNQIAVAQAQAGLTIKGINSVTLSTSTGTAGTFGVTATRKLCSIFIPVANATHSLDWAALGMGKVPNSSAIFGIVLAGTSNTGLIRGSGKLLHG